jgi:HEAT repeat protein
MRQLASSPFETVAYLRKHLTAARGEHPSEREIKRWIAALDDDEYDRREAASRRLSEIGWLAQPVLQETLKTATSLEQKRRAEGLLDLIKSPLPHPHLLRPLRALEVLERMATAEAKDFLQEIAQGDPDAPLTQEAKAALRRLSLR